MATKGHTRRLPWQTDFKRTIAPDRLAIARIAIQWLINTMVLDGMCWKPAENFSERRLTAG